jgi:hypothetical protein
VENINKSERETVGPAECISLKGCEEVCRSSRRGREREIHRRLEKLERPMLYGAVRAHNSHFSVVHLFAELSRKGDASAADAEYWLGIAYAERGKLRNLPEQSRRNIPKLDIGVRT